MKTINWSTANAVRVSVLGLVLVASGPVMAASYNVLLKDASGAALSCATGGFTFDKTLAGSFPTSGAAVNLSGCTFVPGLANGRYVPGTLNVVVENVTLNKPGTGGQNEVLNQGPNVEGLTGTLQFSTTADGNCSGTGSSNENKTYTITFSYAGGQNSANRTYTLNCAGPGGGPAFTTRTGRYHVVNVANVVPEPHGVALVMTGLGALFLSSRMRRRRK